MRCRLLYLILVIFMSVSILTGCDPGKVTDLIDIEWILVSLNGKDLIEDTEITLCFTENYPGGVDAL